MEEIKEQLVEFPLKGEWCAFNTPGFKIPSHGTDIFGQRYAYDFFQIDWSENKGFRWNGVTKWQALSKGVKLEEAYCWSEPIYSPFQGKVIEVYDGYSERDPIRFFRDLFLAIKNGITIKPKENKDLIPLLGNYLILQKGSVYCLIAHTKKGSILVKSGEEVSAGQKLAEVGHSGNSTAPHLHFQLMDNNELISAKGIPCAFKSYESYSGGDWNKVNNGIPNRRERIRA